MKVLHLAGNLEDAGGILSVIRHLQTATAAKGIEHAAFVNQKYVETRRPALDYRFSRFVCSEMESHWGIFWRASLALLEVKRLLAREPFQIVHAHSRCGLLIALGLAALANRTVMFTNHDYARRVRMYQRASLRPNFFTTVLTPNMARHYGLAERPPKVNVISACYADSFLTEPLVRRDVLTKDKHRLRLVGVGSILRWKRWDLLASALLRLSDTERERIEISIFGPVIQSDPDSPKYEMELRGLLREHRLEGRLVLRGSTAAMTDVFRQADWFVLPSTNEPCSVALMEALALGLPALVSASGGNIDLVRDGESGCYFRPDQPEDLANKLRAILESKLQIWPPEKIRESVRERSASAVGEKYCKLYKTLARA